MKVGIALEDENGLYSNVCEHFRKSSHFFILDMDRNKIVSSRIVPNYVRSNGKENKVADEVLKYRITHLIADNIGVSAQKRFTESSIKIFKYSGNVKDAIDNFLRDNLKLAKKGLLSSSRDNRLV